MKALSVKEPWISRIRDEDKTIETRTWQTNYRGDLILVGSREPEGKYSGKICVKVNVIDCRPMTKEDEEAAKVEFEQGLFSWVLKDKVKLMPVNQKGSQGFFNVDDKLLIPLDGYNEKEKKMEAKQMIQKKDLEGKKYKVEYIKTNELLPFEKNPKKHPEKQIEKLQKSMAEFGWTNPILAIKHEEKNLVIAGHARLEAARKLNLENIPVIFLDIPYEKAIVYNIADNKIAELAEWDNALLKDIIMEFKDDEELLNSIGFEEDEINSLLGEDTQAGDEGDFNAQQALEKPKFDIKEGEVFQIGNNFLFCGDSTNNKNVDKLLNGKSPDLLLTDPPYGVRIMRQGDHGDTSKFKENTVKSNKYLEIEGDDKPFDPTFLLSYGKNQIVFGANYFSDKLPQSNCWIVWLKQDPKWQESNYVPFELAWTSYKSRPELYNVLWKGIIREGKLEKDWHGRNKGRLHPTQKPIELFMQILQKRKEDKIILDLFGGSGSTLIACEQLKRNCYMMEIDPRYCSVILERFINYRKHYDDVFRLNEDGSKTPVKELENEEGK